MNKKKIKFRIVSVSPRDGFYHDRKEFIGRTCIAAKTGYNPFDPLVPDSVKNGWHSIDLNILGLYDPNKYSRPIPFFKVKILRIS